MGELYAAFPERFLIVVWEVNEKYILEYGAEVTRSSKLSRYSVGHICVYVAGVCVTASEASPASFPLFWGSNTLSNSIPPCDSA